MEPAFKGSLNQESPDVSIGKGSFRGGECGGTSLSKKREVDPGSRWKKTRKQGGKKRQKFCSC